LTPPPPPGIPADIPARSPAGAPRQGDPPVAGKVFFVGAGPGDHRLLTLRAAELLAAADAVVFDRLVHPSILRLAGEPARLIAAPADSSADSPNRSPPDAPPPDGTPTDGTPAASNAFEPCDPSRGEDRPTPACRGLAVGELLASLCREGRRVVRLKGGDPTVFARLAEEIDPLRRAGLDWEVVPGVTAAVAAAAAARIPLTSRTSASSLTFLTGHQALGKCPGGALSRLAPSDGTLVIYMGVERAVEWSAALIRSGRPADSPVVLVSRCGRPDEQILRTTLLEAPTASAAIAPPAVAIVGDVVTEGSVQGGQSVTGSGRPPPDNAANGARAGVRSTAFGPHHPAGLGGEDATGGLAGRRVLLPRPEGSSPELARALRARGLECLEIPVIRIAPPESWAPLDEAIATADRQDWITFSSAHGVRAFAHRLRALRRDGRHLGTVRLAAVGQRTAAELEAFGLVCDLAPEGSGSADALADLLIGIGPERAAGCRATVVRADRGRDVLRVRLEAAGYEVTEVCGYRSLDVETLSQEAERAVMERPIDWVVLTSPSVARGVVRLFSPRHLGSARVASISPLTTAAAREAGLPAHVEAATASAEGILDAILAHEANRGTS
jgi:uroporphyrinogen III methyltransferase/synthase